MVLKVMDKLMTQRCAWSYKKLHILLHGSLWIIILYLLFFYHRCPSTYILNCSFSCGKWMLISFNARQAFEAAWAAACKVEASTMVVPSGSVFFVLPITFSGSSCEQNIVFQASYILSMFFFFSLKASTYFQPHILLVSDLPPLISSN